MKQEDYKTMPNDKNQALKFAMKLIGLRRRSVFEITKRLEQKNFEKETIKQVLEELDRYGYTDDEKFAESYINDRVNFRPCGRAAIEMGLRKKGIAENIINDKIDGLMNEEKELKLAKNLAERKLKTIGKNTGEREIRQKIASYLKSKGYSFDIINRIIENGIEF